MCKTVLVTKTLVSAKDKSDPFRCAEGLQSLLLGVHIINRFTFI